MGFSANQARFLSLTSRQVDLEYRMQQICHRRIRLASELENIATEYNNAMSDRKLFASTQAIYEGITVSNLADMGYKVVNSANFTSDTSSNIEYITSSQEFIDLLSAGIDMDGHYVLTDDIDLSTMGTQSDSYINGSFNGTFDGNGYSITGLDISTNSSGNDYRLGFFKTISSSAEVKNLSLDATISTTSDLDVVGMLAGKNEGDITNCHTSGTVTSTHPSVDFYGGLVGINTGNIDRSSSSADVDGAACVGGLVASAGSTSVITNSYATGDVDATNTWAGGLVGRNVGIIDSSYADGGTITTPGIGGEFVGENVATGTISNSFWDSSGTGVGNNLGTVAASAMGISAASISAGGSPVTDAWDQNVWNLSSTPAHQPEFLDLEEGLRNGTYSLLREADTFSQEVYTVDGTDWEKVDWRTVPTIDDDLDASNDVDAEAKYDSAIEKINSQDKKLQLEQSQIEVEHKAIVTQKDSVKSILDKNIEKSFKSFG